MVNIKGMDTSRVAKPTTNNKAAPNSAATVNTSEVDAPNPMGSAKPNHPLILFEV